MKILERVSRGYDMITDVLDPYGQYHARRLAKAYPPIMEPILDRTEVALDGTVTQSLSTLTGNHLVLFQMTRPSAEARPSEIMFSISDPERPQDLGTSVSISRRGRWRVHVEGTKNNRYFGKNSARAMSHAYEMLGKIQKFPQRRVAT